MKKKRLLSLAMAVAMIFGSAAMLPEGAFANSTGITASALKDGDFEYIILEDGTAEITGCSASATEITIPNTLGGKEVSSIGDEAFKGGTGGGSSYVQITLPDTVKSIGEYSFALITKKSVYLTLGKNVEKISKTAFLRSNIRSIAISAENDNFCAYNSNMFMNKDRTELICAFGYDQTVKIPSTVESIWDGAFTSASKIASISVNSANKSFCVENRCLYNKDKTELIACLFNTTIDLPEGLKIIRPYACYKMISGTLPSSESLHNFSNLVIPNSVTQIGEYAFAECVYLENVSFGNGLVNIGDCAFYNDKAIRKIALPDTVESIGKSAFENCTFQKPVSIGSSVKSIGDGAFARCSMKSIELPQTLENIGTNVFSGITALKSANIPSGITAIPDGTFSGCINLTDVKIQGNITAIGNKAFKDCKYIEALVLPDSLESVGDSAFDGCFALNQINFPKRTNHFGTWALAQTKWLKNQQENDPLVIVNGILIDATTYDGPKLTIPDNVYCINYNAFDSNKNIEEVIIPDTVISIKDSAFIRCSSLKQVTLSGSIDEISDKSFCGCSALTSITIPDGVNRIGNAAFNSCKSLSQINIPNSVTEIGDDALSDCSNLTQITLPKNLKKINTKQFCCSGLLSVEIPSGVTTIEAQAFQGCSNLSTVKLPHSLQEVKENAFYNLKKLQTVEYDGYKEEWQKVQIGANNEPLNYVTFKEYVCEHNYISTVTRPATCTTNGVETNVCEKCGDTYITVIKAPGHDYVSTIVPATCTSKGYTNHKCSKCNDEYNDTETDMLAHSFGDWITTTAPTCTDKGVETRKCKNCEATETRDVKALGHDYVVSIVPPTCTSKGYTNHKCTRCKDEYNDTETQMTAHSFDDWRVTTDPTCTAKGVETRTCSECKKTETRDVNALGHDYKATVVAPTCTAKGYTLYKCSRCNDEFKDNYTEPTGNHKWSEWKTTAFDVNKGTSTQTRTCSACNKTESKTTKNAVQRLAGAGRYATAVEISKAGFPDGSDTVVLAYGLNYADALAGVSLAKAMNAPILLTNLKTLPAETLAEIKRLKAKNVIILGGTGAVGAEVETALIKEGFKTERIAGATRFETATKIAEKMQKLNDKAPEEVYFVYAFNSADALSVSPIAASKNAPIIYLSTKGDLNADTAAYLAKLKMAGCVKNAYVIGGEGVISNDMMKKAGSALGVTPVRVFGANRFSTCVAVNEKFADVPDSDMLCVATGMDFPDALAGGVYAAINKAPLFLINGKLKTPKLTDEQKSYLKTKAAGKITAFGGTGVVPDNHIADIAKNSI